MVQFSKEGAKRVVETVRTVERTEFHPKGWTHQLDPQAISQNGFYAKITAVETDGTAESPDGTPPQLKYSWERVEAQQDGSWTSKPGWEKGGPHYGSEYEDAFAVHPNGQGTLEVGSYVLLRWSIDQPHAVITHDTIVHFILTEDIEELDGTAKATRYDGTGPTFIVKTDEDLRIFGPAKSGFYGWCIRLPAENASKDYTEDGNRPEYRIIFMQRFAKFVDFTADFTEGCLVTPTSVDAFWDGEDPEQGSIKVQMGSYMPCSCFGPGTQGRAVFNEKSSSLSQGGTLLYEVFDVCQMVEVKQQNSCPSSYTCGGGTKIKELVVGKGLQMQTIDGTCCARAIELQNYLPINVQQTCDGTATGDSTNGGRVSAVNFEGPLSVVVEGDGTCTGTATVDLDLIGGTCIDIEDGTDCSKTINWDGTIEAGNNVQVTKTGCKWRIDADSTIGDTHIVGGTCISVDGTDGTYTVNNDMSVVGGDGINVTKSDCVYSVNLSGSQGDPMTSIQVLCDVDFDVECVQTSGGEELQVTLTKSYTNFDIPSALITNYSTDCGGSGSGSGSGSGDGTSYTCDTCPDCDEGEAKIIKDDYSECDCIEDSAALPEGWTECDGTGEQGDYITFNGIDCDPPTPHVSFTFNAMPEGATSYSIQVTGDKGSSASLGPSYNHEEVPGQEYWGALVDGFGTPQAGECFTFSVTFAGSSVTQSWEACCS